MRDHIVIKGARENNLKNIDVEIPRDALVVMTGLSGSGKSSLAFDTIFAEGQRRYMESLSSYARQFLGQMDKPDVDSIEGMSPAISIDQKTTSKIRARPSAMVTEIPDYLRLSGGRLPGSSTVRSSIRIAAAGDARGHQPPVVRARKGRTPEGVYGKASPRAGVIPRVRGQQHLRPTERSRSIKTAKHNIEIVVDRVVIRPDQNRRLTDAVEIASALSGGLVLADIPEEKREILFSQNYACGDCGISIEAHAADVLVQHPLLPACRPAAALARGAYRPGAHHSFYPSKSILLDGGITASGWNVIKDESISQDVLRRTGEKYHFDLYSAHRRPAEHVRGSALWHGDEELTLHYDTNHAGWRAPPFEHRQQRAPLSGKTPRAIPCVHQLQGMAERPARTATARGCGRVLAVTVGPGWASQVHCTAITEELAFLGAHAQRRMRR